MTLIDNIVDEEAVVARKIERGVILLVHYSAIGEISFFVGIKSPHSICYLFIGEPSCRLIR